MSNIDKENLKEAVLLAPFACGAQSYFMSKDEFMHRVKGFKASKWYKEPRQELEKLINAEVMSVLEEIERTRLDFGGELAFVDILESNINSLKEKYHD